MNFVNEDGETALGQAAKGNNVEIVKLLMNNGCEPTMIAGAGGGADDALFLSAKWGRPEILRVILDVHPEIDLNKVNDDGETALHAAALYGHHSLLPILLTRYNFNEIAMGQHFIDPFVVDKNRRTALAVALNGGQSKGLIQAVIYQYQTSTYVGERVKRASRSNTRRGNHSVYSNCTLCDIFFVEAKRAVIAREANSLHQ